MIRLVIESSDEIMICVLPRPFDASSARPKDFRRAWLQHAASVIGPALDRAH
jgi:hypothetical protein